MMLAILQSRMSSSRMPGKVMKPLCGKPMLLQQINRIKESKLIDHLVVATTEESSDDPIVQMCQENDIPYYRGSLNNVLDRYVNVAQFYKAKHIVRLTGDCPLIDPNIIDQVIKEHVEQQHDYTSNCINPTYPDGLDTEVLTIETLEKIYSAADRPSLKEHVTLYVIENKKHFKIGSVEHTEDLSSLRWTVDEPEDYELVTLIYDGLYKETETFLLKDILMFLEKNPQLLLLNQSFVRNEGLKKSLEKELK